MEDPLPIMDPLRQISILRIGCQGLVQAVVRVCQHPRAGAWQFRGSISCRVVKVAARTSHREMSVETDDVKSNRPTSLAEV